MRLIDAYWHTLALSPVEQIEAQLEASLAQRKAERAKRSLAGKKAHSSWIHNAFTKARNMMGEG